MGGTRRLADTGRRRTGRDARGLAATDRVHRSVYTDPAIFDLEMERIFAKAWVYVGHESQVPTPGDFITIEKAGLTVTFD